VIAGIGRLLGLHAHESLAVPGPSFQGDRREAPTRSTLVGQVAELVAARIPAGAVNAEAASRLARLRKR
jgi:hypothetical protein